VPDTAVPDTAVPDPGVPDPSGKPRVGLFVTCLVDLYRPSIGFAAIELLTQAGCQVEVPEAQTCCGQPAYNSGNRALARELARGILDAFGGFDYVVAPSGSCAGMLKRHLPQLFDDDPNSRARADRLAERVYELTSFLVDVRGFTPPARANWPGTVTYHDGCSGLRELGVKAQPRKLLAEAGATVVEMANPEICCGFGGTFCVKFPEISTRMVSDKVRDIDASRAATLLAGDLGCLMNIRGLMRREHMRIEVRHIAEVLVDQPVNVPPLGVSRENPA
jgi:L-lactate dehydrogenase complex protein LldE